MNRFFRIACGLGLVTAFVLPACGGATTDSTSFSSGLPPGKSLGDLTGADDARLCSSLNGYLRNGPGDDFCRFVGLLSAGLQQGFFASNGSESEVRKLCADAQTACERKLHADGGGGFACHAPPSGSRCTATVREYEACVGEQMSAVEQALAGLPACSSLTLSDVAPAHTDGGKFDLNGGPSCKALEDHCPDAVGSQSVSTDGGSSGTSSGSEVFDAGAAPVCGNGVVDPGEDCDGANLRGLTCSTVTMGARPSGTIRCAACHYDVSGCM